MLRKPQLHAVLWTAILVIGISLPGRTAHHLTVFTPDKLLHFGGFVVLAVLWLRVYPTSSLRILAYGALFGILTELYQHLMPINRTFDLLDALADFGGLVVGVYIGRSLTRSKKRGRHSNSDELRRSSSRHQSKTGDSLRLPGRQASPRTISSSGCVQEEVVADAVPLIRADPHKILEEGDANRWLPYIATPRHSPARLTPTDMALRKTEKADIRSRYPLYVQIGLALALVLIIGAFTIPLAPSDNFEIILSDQEIIEVEEIEQTQQLERPPPPPAPPPPQEVPDEEIIEEQVIDITQEIDLSETPPAPPPPPPPPTAAPPPPPPPPPPEPEIFEVVEQMPVLQGGLEALQAAIQYPEMARRSGIEGRVFVQFVVDEQGRPTEVRAVRGIGGGCDEAAVNAVRNARFSPGLQRGRPVKVRMSLPVTFRLN